MIYSFGDAFTLDTRRCELWRGDERVHLEPQVYATLCHLVAHRDRLVTKDELLDEIWGHRFVTPGTLNSRIKALRQALGDDGVAQRFVRTVRGRGFRFVADVAARAEGHETGGEGAARRGQPSPAATASDPLARGGPSPDDAGAAVRGGAVPADTGAAIRGGTLPGKAGAAGAGSLEDAASRGAAASTGPVDPAPEAVQEIRFCRARDGVRIAYATSGTGPPLVKPANWLTHLEQDWNSPVWRHWLEGLGRTHTLIRYDERGCGLSDHDIDDFSFDAWVSDLEAVVDTLGLERFPLLGISQGCAVAVAYAARHRERISRLVLYGGYACGRNHRNPSPQQQLEANILQNLIRVGWGRDNPAFRQVFGTLFLPEGTPEQLQWFNDLSRTMPMENALRVEQTAHHIDVRQAAATLDVPTIVLHARGDAMIPFEAGRTLAAIIPRARFVPLDSRNHVLMAGEPAWTAFLREVTGFLADDDARLGPPAG